MGKIIEYKRPPWCYDKSCKILLSRFEQSSYDKGFSSFCYGQMPEPKEQKHNEALHVNDICHCYYTPFKGAIRYFMNEGDLWGEINAKIWVLNKVNPIRKCSKCKKDILREIRVCKMINRKEVCYDCED